MSEAEQLQHGSRNALWTVQSLCDALEEYMGGACPCLRVAFCMWDCAYFFFFPSLNTFVQKVDKKPLADMKKIEALFATSRNYKTYRDVLATATPPLVPHIGNVAILHCKCNSRIRSAGAEGLVCYRGDKLYDGGRTGQCG